MNIHQIGLAFAVPEKSTGIPFFLRFLFGSLGMLAAAMLVSGCTSARQEYRKTFSVAPGTVLKIYNGNGSVDVSSWGLDHIEVYAVKQGIWGLVPPNEASIEVTTGNQVVIRTRYATFRSRGVSVQYRIMAPKGVLVTQVETANGRINVENVSGDVDAITSRGDIQIHKVNGFVKAVTSNGKIDIAGVDGVYKACTSRGAISAEVQAIRDSLEIASSVGSITVFLSPGIAAQLEANTSAGAISYGDLPLVVSQSSKTRIVGRIGAGGGVITVSTSVGSINLKRLGKPNR